MTTSLLSIFGIVVALGILGRIFIQIIHFSAAVWWHRRYRVTMDSIPLKAVANSDDLEAADVRFLESCNRHYLELRLQPLFVSSNELKHSRLTSSYWAVPDTRLIVTKSLHRGVGKRALCKYQYTHAYIRRGDPHRITISDDYLNLSGPIESIERFGIRVVYAETPVPRMVALVWALAVRAGVDLSDPGYASDHLDELNTLYKSVFEDDIAAGRYAPSGPDTYRLPLRVVLAHSARRVPWIAQRICNSRWKVWQKDFEEVSDLLPAGFDDPWLISAVQDRVRTGSTAPLTQP